MPINLKLLEEDWEEFCCFPYVVDVNVLLVLRFLLNFLHVLVIRGMRFVCVSLVITMIVGVLFKRREGLRGYSSMLIKLIFLSIICLLSKYQIRSEMEVKP